MFLCRFVQTWMSLQADSARPPAAWCRQHLASCPACRRAAETTAQLVRGLQHSAGGLRRATPPFLAGRIAASARNPGASSSGALWGLSWRRIAGNLGAASLAVLAAVAWWSRDTIIGPPSATSIAASQAHHRELVATLPLKLPDPGNLLGYSARLDEPLEQEWQNMLADGRAAARSLAAAFVPESTIEF